MAAVTICSDFRAHEEEICHYFHLVPFYLPGSDGTGCQDLSFLNNEPAFSLSSFTLIKSLLSSFSLSAIRMVSFTYLRLLIFLPAILIPACNLSSPAFHRMYSVYKLNMLGDHKQPCHTSFSALNQSVVPCKVLAVASWPVCRFLRRQVRWSGIPISLRVFHGLLWSTQSNAVV